MSKIRFIALLSLAMLGLVFLFRNGNATSAAAAKLEPGLREGIENAGSGTYWVYLADKADLSAAYNMTDWSARGQYVYDALRQTAQSSQADLVGYLDAQTARGAVQSYRTFFIVNVVLVTSDLDVFDAVAARADVTWLASPKTYEIPDEFVSLSPESPTAIEWGIDRVRAPEIWADFGRTGEGVVVANVDTGVDYDHPAVVNQYRGNLGGSFDHDFNWYDPSIVCPPGAPCDNNNHGTHTMGTMVGDDGGANQIGMAPGAKWIAAKGCESSSCSDFALLSSAEWIAAPCPLGVAPGDPSCDPDMRPNVVNNSWGGGGGDPWYQASVDVWRAMGIFPAFSAGNSGPGAGTIGSPGDYCNVTASGATDISDIIASFSSRGPGNFPACLDKPDVSAPGVNVRSSINGGGYANFNGTSMASPHTAGCVALLLSIEPTLTYDQIYDNLITTGVDLGAPGFDNDYGYGRLDCYEAALLLSPDFYLNATPAMQDACVPDSAVFNIEVGQIQGFDDPVTLSASGVPGGYMASFAPNPVIPPDYSDMTVANVGAAAAGSYDIEITGMAPTSTHTTMVTLNLFDATPGTTTLTYPPNNAQNIDLVPTMTWTAAAQASGYRLRIYEGAGGTPIYDVTVAETSHTLGMALEPLTVYRWTVVPMNPCGEGAMAGPYYFQTRDIPPILLVDDDDNSPDVRSYYIEALDSLGLLYDVWDTNNTDTEPSATELAPYEAVIWFTGDEFGGAAGPGAAGESALGTWLDSGKCLFISSQDYHYDRGQTAFMTDYLGLGSAVDDAGNYTSVTGQGAVFGGLGPYALAYPFTDYSDIFTAGAAAELAFVGDNGNGAAIDKDDGVYRTSFWGYPFEAISTLDNRLEAMQTVVNWCGTGVDTGTLSGSVTDEDSGMGIGGASVTAVGSAGSRTVTTNADGDYTMTLAVGSYDVTADAANYVPETAYGVVIITDTVTMQDFALQGSALTYSPPYIEETMEIGDVVSTTVTLMNDGPLPIDWEASIGNYGGPGGIVSIRPVSISIPRFEGELPADSAPPSTDRAPDAPMLTPEQATELSAILGEAAYGLDVFPGSNLVMFPDADVPGSWNIIGSVPQFHPAADFLNGDFSTLYALDYDTNQFVTIDTATGARTVVGTTAPNGNWSGMTGATDGTLYAVSSVCGTNSTLYTVDPDSGALTTVGNVGAGTCIIDIAINAAGEMYGVDIVSDALYQIDPNTGAGTPIGPLGAAANFAQGMDFEETSGILYWAAYTAAGEMRVIDTNTGASALVGGFPGGAEVDGLAFATGGAGGAQWASAVPDAGTVPAGGSATFEVVFDARSLISTGDYTAELEFSGTFVNEVPPMPLTMHLGCTNCGFLEGAITDALTGDPVEAEIHVTGPGGYDVTVSGDNYSLAVQPGSYDIMVSADGYLPDSETVVVAQGQTVVTDFALYPEEAFLEYSPAYIEEWMEIGDVVSTTVTVMNTGYTTLDFEVNIGNYGGPGAVTIRPVSVSIPRFEGELPADSAPPSTDRAPDAPMLTPEQATELSAILGEAAYGLDVFPGSNLVMFPDADVPGSWNIIGSVPQFHPAADFLNGDFSTLYAMDYDTNQFVSIDTATGARTVIGTSTPNGSWTGMTGATDGTLYAVSSVCGTNSTLYTVDPDSGALTTVGNIGAGTCIIDIAINAAGEMYGVDIVTDVLYQIDPNTGVGTLIGPLGAAANFAQGLDFEETSGILYWAAYTAAGEMRVIDTNTGASALVGGFPGGAEVDGLAFATGGAGGAQWASAVPDYGSVPAGGSMTFEVVFDARSLIQVGDYTAELEFSGNFTNNVPPMPLTMHLSCPTCGILEGSVTDAWTGDPLTADIHVTGPGGFDYMTTGDSYSIAVPAGMYDFTVSADGYFDGTATVEAIAGVTVVTDFALIPQVALLEYMPDTIEVTVPLGGSVVETLMMHNIGTLPFDFSLTDVETGSPAAALVTCPPDAYGYSCTDSTEPDGLVSYAFEDISGTGTPISLGDDQVSGAIPLGFTFNYYGTDYTELYVSSNGFLTVNAGSSNGCCSGQQLPNTATPNGVISGWWEDLNPASGGTIHYQTLGTAPNYYLVVQFTNVPHYPSGLPVTMQFKLFANSNNIEVHYMDAPSDAGQHSAGIEDQAGAVGLSYYYGTAPLASDLAVCYLYPGQFACGSGGGDAAWVWQNPDEGTIDAGMMLNVDVVFDASVVTQTGTYEAQLYFDGTFENDVPPATLIMHVVEPDIWWTMDYTFYTQSGMSHSGTMYFDYDGTFTDESGDMGMWEFFPQPPRVGIVYTDGSNCSAAAFGRYVGDLHVFGLWSCRDGSGRRGVWTGTILTGALPEGHAGQPLPFAIPE